MKTGSFSFISYWTETNTKLDYKKGNLTILNIYQVGAILVNSSVIFFFFPLKSLHLLVTHVGRKTRVRRFFPKGLSEFVVS